MRVILFFVLLIWLAGCAPANVPDETPDTTPDATSTIDQGVPLFSETSTPATGSGSMPDLSWPADSSHRVLLGTFCCGFTTQAYVTNYIPEFQVWGDGRFYWALIENGKRVVYEAQLEKEEISVILKEITAEGFFSWQDRYEDPLVTDMADKCIRISLLADEKSVCEYYRGAPEAFHRLFDRLATGAGKTGQVYTPESGYLTATPIEAESVAPQLVWDQAEVSLASVGESGMWVDGKALPALWEAVNTLPTGPVVEEQGEYYVVTLQIVGLSLRVPPQK